MKKENSISINNELTLFKNSINYSKNKLKKNKSNSNISYIIYKNKPNEKRVHNRCKSNKMQNINISYNNIAFIQNKNDNISNNLKKINLTVQREKSSNSFFEKQKIKNMINNNSNKKNRIKPL